MTKNITLIKKPKINVFITSDKKMRVLYTKNKKHHLPIINKEVIKK